MKQMVPLFKFFLKQNWKMLLIFVAAIGFYCGIIVFMATDPMMVEAMGFLNMESATTTMGITEATLAMNITLAVFQGMIMYIFVMIFYVLLVHKLLYKTVDTTSLSSLLSTPVSRKQYIATAYIFMAKCLFVLYLFTFLLTGGALLTYGSSFSWLGLLSVHVTTFLCTLAVASISFAFSALFAGARAGTPLLAGIPIAFAAFMMLGAYLPFFQYVTPFTLFKWTTPIDLASKAFGLWWLLDLVFAAISAAAFSVTLILFKRKQLSI